MRKLISNRLGGSNLYITDEGEYTFAVSETGKGTLLRLVEYKTLVVMLSAMIEVRENEATEVFFVTKDDYDNFMSALLGQIMLVNEARFKQHAIDNNLPEKSVIYLNELLCLYKEDGKYKYIYQLPDGEALGDLDDSDIETITMFKGLLEEGYQNESIHAYIVSGCLEIGELIKYLGERIDAD